MKAVICPKYGSPDVLRMKDLEKPTPKDNELLIKIHASSVTTADGMMRQGTPLFGRLFIGLLKPKHPVTGTGFSGVVEAIGKAVNQFNKGDAVFGESIFGAGTNAEYVCVAEDGILTALPNNMTFEEAAPVCDGALTSLSFLKDIGQLQSGQKVLINGASGSLGTAAIQLAKYFGAEVTGVCSKSNVKMVQSLGADKVIDYTLHDFTKNEQTYDLIYDTVGKSSYSLCKKSLTKNGAFISPVLGLNLLFHVIWTSLFSNKKAKFSATGVRPIPELRILLQELKEIIEKGELKSIIDKAYNLDQAVEAHNYVEGGHKKGNVILKN
jgi:NADPH:quinone reductase-like Zn-dependent oxidoreductase